MCTHSENLVSALSNRITLRGVVAKPEKLCALTEREKDQVKLFLVDWQSDAVFAVALHFANLRTKEILALVDCGWIRQEQLQEAIQNFLNCWSKMEKHTKSWNYWLRIRVRIHELSLAVDEDGLWYLFPKLQELLIRYEGDHQPGLFYRGPFASIAH